MDLVGHPRARTRPGPGWGGRGAGHPEAHPSLHDHRVHSPLPGQEAFRGYVPGSTEPEGCQTTAETDGDGDYSRVRGGGVREGDDSHPITWAVGEWETLWYYYTLFYTGHTHTKRGIKTVGTTDSWPC